eukprot:CAMPEP_0197834170 /NCGR_PEP_ID=MMETSP1437-20131217/21407_1 /TAXON_ID=49252 ORGANISM="Eucampia antarctica, Strain CCMP1452" /NCGR_SAMPLE_ID=MMETSP1437 /ASSEMBLY_ACC=CAM_ASM_001096 /LENGTH=1278 /DNA_ID=CAMNT_0043438661 /DNA_START=251 /DNA_END=4087 /DNA_ORIENTATION=-
MSAEISSISNSVGADGGRVVRLHFTCRAELPLGSTLRVTGSTLCAPGSLTNDPTDGAVSVSTSPSAAPNNANMMADESQDGWHASSIEMVTTPETYPLWTTRTPVVVTIHPNHHNQIQHHLYRYLVVTPGACPNPLILTDDDTNQPFQGADGMGSNTSNDVPVMMWEDPFHVVLNNNASSSTELDMSRQSAISLSSMIRPAIAKNLANLPFRTLDIDVTSGKVLKTSHKDETKDEDVIMVADDESCTPHGTCVDIWNKAEDYTFRHYIVRDAIHKQNKARMKSVSSRSRLDSDLSDYASESTYPTDNNTNVPSAFNNKNAAAIEQDGEKDHNIQDEDTQNPLLTTPPDIPRKKKDKQRIFFVCYHLPVIVSKDIHTGSWSACWAESLLAQTEGSGIVKRNQAHWVGTVTTNPPISTAEDREAVTSLLEKMSCTPLFLEEDIQEAHYLGMCKQVLWPAFHNIDLLDLSGSGWIPSEGTTANPSSSSSTATSEQDTNIQESNNFDYPISAMESDWDQSRLGGWWKAYQLVNQTFAQAMSNALLPGDIMWVHDYHLSLLPKFLSDLEYEKYKTNVTRKIFFLHIPFPTSQIFRELECGESILEGMLHADVVGFHAFDHARHFLNAAKRILGLNYESLVGGLIGVQYRRKTVLVTMHNVSIEPKMVDAALALPSVPNSAAYLRQKHAGRIVISGVDVAQRLSGICLKLLAYERLLTDYPIWLQKVVLVQKCLIPGSRHADEANTIREVRYLVRRITEKFSSSVINYEEVMGSSLPIDQRLALWTASDVMMTTPIREGLNLLPLEYIYARKEPAKPGIVIASEFAAVCSILNGALRVNPFDIQMTVTSIDKALTMEVEEREGRRCRDAGFVSTSPSDQWTKHVLRDLTDATACGTDNNDTDDDSSNMRGNNEKDKSDLITTTSAFLARDHESAFSHLNSNAVLRAYNRTKRRVIILDFNGTIVIKEPPGKYLKRDILGTSGNKPPQSVIKALTALCADPKNTVFVVSGDAQENVENAVSHIPGLGMAASNGACFVRPLKPGDTEREWRYFDLGVDWEAVKRIVLPVLSKYTARTNGSFVKMTHSSIGWSYYSCDPEWGSLQASHLVLELEGALRPFDVRFAMIKGIVEIVPRRLNKGLIVKKVLREVAASDEGAGVDFIMCMGDDVHDEKMFTSVFSFIAEVEDVAHVVPSPPVVADDDSIPVLHRNDSLIEDNNTSLKYKGLNEPMYAFTAAVGKKTSHASYYVDDARDVASLLVQLSGVDVSSLNQGPSFGVQEMGLDFFA